MAKQSLVVVESAAKAKTIEKFLGRGYSVRACLGHVRDLPTSRLGVDVEHHFQPQYVVSKERKDVVKRLKDEARGKESVLLATDPDREGEQQRHPDAPFTTSTLQQEASRKLGFSARRTMVIAQQLYEGMDVGDGEVVGLITYMRTDSVNIAQSAQAEAREYIRTKLANGMLP